MPALSSLGQLIPAGAVGSQRQDYDIEASLGYTAKPYIKKNLSRLKTQSVRCLLCNHKDLHLIYRAHKIWTDVVVQAYNPVLGRQGGLTGQSEYLNQLFQERKRPCLKKFPC